MKTKEEIETSITRSLIETSKPEMLKYVTSVPYGFNKPNYEAMSLMVYGYNQCQEDMADKKYTEEDMRRAYNKGNNTARAEYEKVVPEYIKPMEFEDFIKLLNNEK
jgi:hypothetical protein